MSEQLRRYRVEWHTSPSPGATYYQGETDVWAEDDEDAISRAKQEIHRRMFPDYRTSSHICIDSVARTRN
jgi:hypothetical protein